MNPLRTERLSLLRLIPGLGATGRTLAPCVPLKLVLEKEDCHKCWNADRVSPFAAGKPVITSLSKRRAGEDGYKVLTCEADGVPEPSFQWSINSTVVSLQTGACC